MTLHALPAPGAPSPLDDPRRTEALAKAEAELHQIQTRLQRLQADWHVQRAEQQATPTPAWNGLDRRHRERRR